MIRRKYKDEGIDKHSASKALWRKEPATTMLGDIHGEVAALMTRAAWAGGSRYSIQRRRRLARGLKRHGVRMKKLGRVTEAID